MKIILLAFLMLVAGNSFAQETTTEKASEPINKTELPENLFKDKNTVKYILKSQGIEASQLDWTQISSLCSAMQNVSVIEQNKCEYNRARALFSYTQESSFCKKFSESFYSSQLSVDSAPQRYLMQDKLGNSSEVTLTKIGSKIGKSRSLQQNEYLRCMKNHGWVNPDNWKSGKETLVNYY